MRKFLLIFLLLMSGSSFAVTKSEAFANCAIVYATKTSTQWGPLICRARVGSWANTANENGSITIGYDGDPTAGAAWFDQGYQGFNICLSPAVLTYSTGKCYTPKECSYPESDNGSGVCANNSCPVGQNRNPITNLCQTPPTCATAETYDTVKNACTLLPLHCPTHFHPSTTNDACLADPKLACPLGQHDDGTYLCVADNSTACTSAQQYGMVNGVPQCVAKPNVLDTAQQVAQANETARVANAALALDPTNFTKQATALAANQAAGITSSNAQSVDLGQISTGIDALNQKATDAAKVLADKLTADSDALDAEIAEIDALKASNLGTNLVPEKSTFTSILLDSIPSYDQTASCPADIPIVLSFKTINFPLTRICELALGIRPLFLSLAWLAAGRIVFASMVS